MKVKVFEHIIQTDENWSHLSAIEAPMNTWLADNPEVEIVDVKLSVASGTNNERAAPAAFIALCMVFYKD